MLEDLADLIIAQASPLLRHATYAVPLALMLMVLTARDTCACSTVADSYRTVMRWELRRIVALQESQRAAGGRFLDTLPVADPSRASFVVLIEMRATADGFHAEVGYPSRTVNRCRISHRWGQVATPACDFQRRYQTLLR